MARICRKCLQVGIIVAFGAFLTVNAIPSQPYRNFIVTEPQLTAGASRFPVIKWQTTEVKVIEPEPEINTVAEPPQAPVEEVVEEIPTEPIEPQETAPEPQEIDDIDLLYRTVQAEGYTMGYDGMRYITSAIQNLARDRGCSIRAVLTSGAYTVVNNGQIWRETLYPDTIAAVDDDLANQIDTEIKYFRTNHYHGFGTPCFSWGNVYFSK